MSKEIAESVKKKPYRFTIVDVIQLAENYLELEQENERLREALQVFASCIEQIDDDENDDEWATFRLTVADYRKAAKALRGEEV